MITAVLDTNVLISGVFWKGPPFEVLKSWQERRFRLAVSRPILLEYRRVLNEVARSRPFSAADSIIEIIEIYAELVEPIAFAKPVCSDPDDDKFLEAAAAARADYVVSGDLALLKLKRHDETDIVKPARFLSLLPR